ncbi:hypothetical protein RD792_007706 [Penstemon davidsonii]|uniref:Uncharacterized protein n=1 Tax=Penstemon davidsonii TaxID=160366 RepID=A0ABR0D757_9LAMI|nr:hypothetical protein RD792_007706 [Penstemon davidsonii]
MAEAFVQILVDNLSSLIQGKIGLIMGVNEEMNKLSSTLTTIQAVLEDAEEKQLESKAIRNWLCKLNDLTYEIDDILDECATEVSKSEHKINKKNRLKKILYQYKIGRRMKEVTKKLDAVAAERTQYHLREMVVDRQSKVVPMRQTCSVLNESHPVFGRDEEKEKIVDILVNQMSERKELSVLPIIGIGGLGKTTLAQLVFNDKRVADHFEIKLWICVSDEFDIITLIKAILEFASGNGSASNSLHLDTLRRRLSELLNQKRYLLVLDDVWNEDQEEWSLLKSYLACGSSGASIVVTTRLKSVVDIMSTFPAHHLAGLSEEDCWDLMKQRAFGHEEEEHPNLEAIGKHIVKKCAGVPLAAKALGGLLRFKRNEKEWIHVKESEIWNLSPTNSLILPALRLSYNHLPLRLRQCFAFCSVFPKDNWIYKEELIHMWMAHGYISSTGTMEVEDVGNEIWNELVLRGLFQDVSTDFMGEVCFKMHDLVHDLAQSIMENKVICTQVEINKRSVPNTKIRQVNLINHCVAFPTRILPNLDLTSALMSYSRLRFLNASCSKIDDLPSEVGKLKHLRCLNLSDNKFRSLPNAICSLWNLKILNLNYCHKLVSLPKDMRYMRNLRHLLLEYCGSLSEMPPSIGELDSLQTLSLFIVGHEKDNQLKELEFLNLGGKLIIKHLEKEKNLVDAKKAILAKKQNLRDLKLLWKVDNASKPGEDLDDKVIEALQPHPNLEKLQVRGFKGNNFPLWMGNSTLENIVEIIIERCPNCLRFPQGFGELPRLKMLTLEELAVQYIIEDDNGGVNSLTPKFPRLEELYLYSLPNLKGLLKVEMVEMFPNLETLSFSGCPSVILPKLSSLKSLYAFRCSSVTLTSFAKLDNVTKLVMEIGESITCVPQQTLGNLTNLKCMTLVGPSEHSLPVEGLRGLKSVKELDIQASKTLTYLPKEWIQHLNALETLDICYCPEFVEFPEEIKYLQTLTRLTLRDLPKMTCLPNSLQHLLSLQSLLLEDLPRLTLLPDWLGNFTSLDALEIRYCPNIASLPAIIQGMENLKTLEIASCPELKTRCGHEKEKGEDWHKIAHIPDLHIY